MTVLREVADPASRKDIVSAGIVQHVEADEKHIYVVLRQERRPNPFLKSLARRVKSTLENKFDQVTVTVDMAEAIVPQEPAKPDGTRKVKYIVAIASGKGGVGKSTVTANLAVELHRAGFSVGVLDADIYGPSQPKMFASDTTAPAVEKRDGVEYIIPVEAQGIKLASIGFFISPDDALVWRGPMATSALRQLIHQTDWGELDFLLIDMPPGTGDVHLSIVEELHLSGAIIVSTPQQVAVADVLRGIRMFQAPKIDVPVWGIIENMAWFSPAELPDNRYYIFGHSGARQLAEKNNIDFLGEIPLILSVMQGAEDGIPAAGTNKEAEKYYSSLVDKIVNKAQNTVSNPDKTGK